MISIIPSSLDIVRLSNGLNWALRLILKLKYISREPV